jgi:hypothetical protein
VSSSLSQPRFTRIPSFFVKFSVLSSSYSPILDRLPIHSWLLVFIPSFCSLGEYVSRPLLCENFIFAFLWVCYDLPAIEYAAMPLLQKKPLIDFIHVLSVSSNLVSIPRSRVQLLPQSYVSCLQSRSTPFPSPLLLSRLYFVFVSISSMSSLQYRRYALIRSFVLRQSFAHFHWQFSTFITSPSSMYSHIPFYCF